MAGTAKNSTSKKELRAPPPAGITRNGATNQSEFSVIFEMLDDKKLGALNRGQARNFLRCVGWCGSNEQLDEKLTESRVGQETVRKIELGFYSAQDLRDRDAPHLGQWTCEDLINLNVLCQNWENNSLDKVKASLRRLSSGRAKIGRDHLLAVLEEYHGITEDDFNQTLEMCGIGSFRELLDCDALAYSLLNRIVNPPSMRELDYMCPGADAVQWNPVDLAAAPKM